MLYYSGYTRRIGDVDEGSTVTDFLPAERARGITIQSAAISFHWPPQAGSAPQPPSTPNSDSDQSHAINLIDTPGHADFTFEVLRSLRVLDGAVCILDGVAGVEAQTEKVWAQADSYNIPRLIYVNKLDREGAAFARTVKEVAARLHGYPALCSIPWWTDADRKLCGTHDVVKLHSYLWAEGSDGRNFKSFTLDWLEQNHSKQATELKTARVALVELLSEHDEIMVEKFFEHDEDHLAIPAQDIVDSLRRCVLSPNQEVYPLLAGASFRNLGVQPLLDAVNYYLPCPTERPDPTVRMESIDTTLTKLLIGDVPQYSFAASQPKKSKGRRHQSTGIKAITQGLTSCALAFKVVNDPKRGILVYVRVYSGRLERGSAIYNTNLHVTERIPKVLKMYASDAVDIPYIEAGQIGVLAGLKHARTGDTLITYTGPSTKSGPPAPIDTLQLRPIDVPPPVFWVSVEPNSLSEEKHLNDSLDILLREDPSLQINTDPESGQKHLAGMGELHLEIARDRLLKDFRAKAYIGKVEISYREALQHVAGPEEVHVQREYAGKNAHAGCAVSVQPLDGDTSSQTTDEDIHHITLMNDNKLRLRMTGASDQDLDPDTDEEARSTLPAHLTLEALLTGARNGATAGLAKGSQYGFPLSSILVDVHIDVAKHIFPDTNAAAIASAVREGIQKLVRQSAKDIGATLLEPVMLVKINMNESDLGAVVQDLSSARGAQVLSLDSDEIEGDASGASQKTLIDLKRVYAPPDPFSDGSLGGSDDAQADAVRQVTARVPLREMLGYLKHLRSMTGGRGTFVMQVDRFEKVTGPRLKAILTDMRGV